MRDTIQNALRAPKPDPLLEEYRQMMRNNRQILWMVKWLQARGISTRLDHAFSYKGRTYYTLASHPVVRKKKTRMRKVKELLRERRNALILEQKQDPRTQHWFERTA